MKYVATVNDWAGDQHAFGPFPSQIDAQNFCRTTEWGPSFKPDESGQVRRCNRLRKPATLASSHTSRPKMAR
jgi:hypothetical protein